MITIKKDTLENIFNIVDKYIEEEKNELKFNYSPQHYSPTSSDTSPVLDKILCHRWEQLAFDLGDELIGFSNTEQEEL